MCSRETQTNLIEHILVRTDHRSIEQMLHDTEVEDFVTDANADSMLRLKKDTEPSQSS